MKPIVGIPQGSIYVRLFHGRKDPEEDLDGWGADGPVLGPFEWYHSTYLHHIRVGCWPPLEDIEWEITAVDGLVYYDGMFYGDVSVVSADTVSSAQFLRDSIEEFDPDKAQHPDACKRARGGLNESPSSGQTGERE